MIVFNIISIKKVSEIGPKSTLITPTPLTSKYDFMRDSDNFQSNSKIYKGRTI
jgi:hypothetical protein